MAGNQNRNRKRNRNRNRNKQGQQQPRSDGTFTKEQILEMASNSDVENLMIAGTDMNGRFYLYSTIMAPGFIHHMANDTTYFVSTETFKHQAKLAQQELENFEEVEEAPSRDQ